MPFLRLTNTSTATTPTKNNKKGIILCKNFHLINSELLEIFYSYMQKKLIENLKIDKEIRDFLDMPKRQKTSTGPKTHVLGI